MQREQKLHRIVTVIVVAVFLIFAVAGLSREYGLTSVEDWKTFGENLFEFSSAPVVSTSLENPLVSVHMIDIGQGDATLVRTPEGDILIDGGEAQHGPVVADYLHSVGVTRLDLIIATHPHSDHIGGLAQIIQEFDVGEVLMPDIPPAIMPTSRTFTTLLETIRDNDLFITTAEAGSTYDWGEDVTLTLLGFKDIPSDLNNLSIVSRLDCGSTSFLFTGDLEKWGEDRLIDERNRLSVDVLSVGHHGSNTSTTTKFLAATSPEIGLISCGIDNSYGHPHKDVMERLDKRNVTVYRTDLDGTVVVESDGEQLAVATEKGELEHAA